MNAVQTDQSVISDILKGGYPQERAIKMLYEKFFHLTRDGKGKYHQLSEEDLISAYNSSIIAFRRHVLQGTFRGDSSIWTYLNRVFYNKCIDFIRKHSSNKVDAYEDLPDSFDDRQNIYRQMNIQEDFQQLLQQIKKLGEPCKQIILDSEYWGYSSDEIAQRIGFSNARSVNSKKYTCLQKLHKLLHLTKTGK